MSFLTAWGLGFVGTAETRTGDQEALQLPVRRRRRMQVDELPVDTQPRQLWRFKKKCVERMHAACMSQATCCVLILTMRIHGAATCARRFVTHIQPIRSRPEIQPDM